MKKIAILSSFLLFLMLVFQSCSMFCEKGRGKIATETRPVAEFNELNIKGQAEVFLVQGLESSVKLSIDSNLLKYIKTEVSGSKLKIYEDKCLEEISEYKIYITAKNLSDLTINGAVKMTADSLFRTDKLVIRTENSGNISLNLDVEDLDVITKGSGLLKLAGRAANFDISLKGAGSIESFLLQAKNTDVDVTGAGTCEISVSEKLSGEVSGSGKLFYKGNPKKVETNNTGTGIIQTK
jgi:hypothetical protein